MSQNSVQFPTSSPPAYPGVQLTTDLNGAFQTIIGLQQGLLEPTAGELGLSSLAGIFWHDLTTGALKIRNQADDTWISIGVLDEATNTFIPVSVSATPQQIVTSNYAATSNDQVINVDASGGAVTITVNPSFGSPSQTKIFEINKIDTSTNIVSISDGTNVIYALVSASPDGVNAGSWANVYPDGTILRCKGSP